MFPRDEHHFEVTSGPDREIEVAGADYHSLRLQAPGISVLRFSQLSSDPKWSSFFDEPITQSQKSFVETTVTGPTTPHDQELCTESNLDNQEQTTSSPSTQFCTFTQKVATVEDREKRSHEYTVINEHPGQTPSEPIFYTYACTCGAPLVRGLPCEHVRAHAAKEGLSVHEIADFRLLSTTWADSYDRSFGEVKP